MRAFQVPQSGSLDQLKLVELPEPVAGAGEILVHWHASSLNYHDYLVVTGQLPVADGRIPMADAAGEVVGVGEGVKQWQVGDKVMSLSLPHWTRGTPTMADMRDFPGDLVDGYACDLSAVKAGAVTRMPNNLNFQQAATLPIAAVTAWNALMASAPKPGDTVLVQGTGGMSIFALQFAKAAGAIVYATTSGEEKAERLRELGADHVINYRQDPKWGNTILKMSGGIDHVLDTGGGASLNQSLRAVKVGGHIALIGVLDGELGQIELPRAFVKQVRMTAISIGSVEMQNQLTHALEANHIMPVIDRVFPFEQLAEAFAYQESGGHFGKIVIEY